MVADVVQMLINAVLLAGIVRLSSGTPPRRFLVQMITNSGVAYIGYGIIGFLFIVLWRPGRRRTVQRGADPRPLYVARWAFVQFGEEQRAHERTLSALVTAVETKDPNAAGHSGRIATARRVDGRTALDGHAGRPVAAVCGDAPRRRQGGGPDPAPATAA